MNLEEIKDKAKKDFVPIIREESSKFLCEICKRKSPKNILEIGTAVGFSGILMLSASPNAFLTTIEIDDKRVLEAKNNFEKAGLSNKVKLIKDDAKNAIEQLLVQGGKEQFDFIFLDGPKGQYIKYLPLLKDLLKVEGVLVADNVFLHGWVNDGSYPSHKHRTMILNLRKFLESIKNDETLKTEIFDLEDGISVSEKIK